MVQRSLAVNAVALALLAAGLAPGAASAQEAGPARAVVGMALEPPMLDPTGGAAAAIDEVVYANVFESLTRIDQTGAIGPGLATGWDVSEDGLTYTFHLREGVTFHDGTPFSAEDVRFSLDRARAPDSTNAQKGYFEAIATIETPDPATVVVTLSRPDGLFLFNMGQGDAAIVSPASADTNATSPVGTGPFRFENWTAGVSVTLSRDPDYTGPDEVGLDEVVFRFVSDPAAQVSGVLAGEIDAFPNIGAPEALAQFESDDRFVVEVGTTEGETVMGLNQRRAPFDDIRVRRAIAHAIDRQAIVDGAMYGYGTPIGSHFAPHHPAYVDLTGVNPYDPEAARALLAEAGYPDGFSTTMTLPPPSYARRGGEIIQAYLAEVGIRVELIPVEWAQWLEQTFTAFDYDMTIVSHTEPMDIGIYARGLDYYFGYQSDTFEALMTTLEATTDPEARNALYGEAQALLAEDLPAVFLFQLAKAGVRDARIEGMWTDSPVPANDMTAVRWAE